MPETNEPIWRDRMEQPNRALLHLACGSCRHAHARHGDVPAKCKLGAKMFEWASSSPLCDRFSLADDVPLRCFSAKEQCDLATHEMVFDGDDQ